MAKDWVNEWLLLTRNVRRGLPEVRPPLTFKEHDLILSIQASEFHYCTPRDNTGPYKMVEVGLVHGKLPHELANYTEGLACDDGDWYEDIDKYPLKVCGYVPVGAVNAIINRLGGIK